MLVLFACCFLVLPLSSWLESSLPSPLLTYWHVLSDVIATNAQMHNAQMHKCTHVNVSGVAALPISPALPVPREEEERRGEDQEPLSPLHPISQMVESFLRHLLQRVRNQGSEGARRRQGWLQARVCQLPEGSRISVEKGRGRVQHRSCSRGEDLLGRNRRGGERSHG